MGGLGRLQDGAGPDLHALRAGALPVFITECTFGLPIYRWPDAGEVFGEIDAWWRGERGPGRTSVMYGYALGKAQRLLAGAGRARRDPSSCTAPCIGSREDYRAAGVTLPPAEYATAERPGVPAALRSSLPRPPRARRAGCVSSAPRPPPWPPGGWRIRGVRRRRNVDRGFILSDHADWPGLLAAIEATGAGRVGVTHGYERAHGALAARGGPGRLRSWRTHWEGDESDAAADASLEEGAAED